MKRLLPIEIMNLQPQVISKEDADPMECGDKTLERNVPAETFPPIRFLFPSRVVMSITDEIRPPYCAPKPAV